MTTNTFQREFILNAREADSLIDALENSRRVDIKLKQSILLVLRRFMPN